MRVLSFFRPLWENPREVYTIFSEAMFVLMVVGGMSLAMVMWLNVLGAVEL